MPVMRHLNVGGTTYDTVGEDFYVDVAANTVRGKLVNNATEYTFERVERIYPS